MFWERVGGRAATKIHSNHYTIYPKLKKIWSLSLNKI
jgi:hypothetical protein